jgi:hypothetical protein
MILIEQDAGVPLGEKAVAIEARGFIRQSDSI